jgi:SAM-dependent methyltransferase
MSARERLLPLLTVPPSRDTGTTSWLDLIDGRPGSRGRIQDLWQSSGGAGAYDAMLAAGASIHSWVPDLLGGRVLRTFYDVADRLRLLGGETVLDLACGPGTLTRRLAAGVGDDGLVIGADLSPAMLDRAVHAVRADSVTFVRADAMALPLRDDTVDAVSCSLCLHLVPDADTALTEIARVLVPGGRLATAVPSHVHGPGRLLTEALARGGQARLFQPGELADLLTRDGFVEVRERWSSGLQIVDAVAPG